MSNFISGITFPWNLLIQRFRPKMILPPRDTGQYLGTSVVVTIEGVLGIKWVGARDAAKHPTVPRRDLHQVSLLCKGTSLGAFSTPPTHTAARYLFPGTCSVTPAD